MGRRGRKAGAVTERDDVWATVSHIVAPGGVIVTEECAIFDVVSSVLRMTAPAWKGVGWVVEVTKGRGMKIGASAERDDAYSTAPLLLTPLHVTEVAAV